MSVTFHSRVQDAQLAPDDLPGVPPHATIIITNFNYGRYLQSSVMSALAQDFPSVDVIVVDDGSSDGSLEKLFQLKTEYPGLTILTQENGGQASAINLGCTHACGDWILFLDADDVLDPSAVRTALSYAATEDSIIQFYLRTIDQDGTVIGLHPFCHVLERGNVFPQICSSGHFRFMPTSGNIFRRANLMAILPVPETEWRICADTYLVLAAASQGVVRTVPSILGSYRIHDANSWYEEPPSQAKLQRIVRNYITVWSDLLELRARWPKSCDDYAVLSLIRRIAISFFVHRQLLALQWGEAKALQRRLRGTILRARVSSGEKILHLLMLYFSDGHRPGLFEGLVSPSAGAAMSLSKLLIASGRDDWLARTAFPHSIRELPLGRTLDFGQGGEGRDFHHFGFGETENWKSWSSAERAGLIFRLPNGISELSLALDVTPYICAARLSSQRVEVRCKRAVLFSGALRERSTISVIVSADMADELGVITLQFVLPDATIPALIDRNSTVTRVTAIALASMTAKPRNASPAPQCYPALTLGASASAAKLLADQPHDGWDCAGDCARLFRRRGHFRFSLPNPAMERFVIRAEFERVPAQEFGDWRVSIEAADIGRDTIDLRETGSAVLVVPRGKAPKSGRFDITCHAFDVLPQPGEDQMSPGPRLLSVVLQRFDLAPGKLSLWRSYQVVDFSADGGGKKYLLTGWHPPDHRGVWSEDTRASLGGFYFADPGDTFITMRLASWHGAGLPQQRVRILGNGVTLIDRELQEIEDVLGIIPRRIIGSDRYLKLEIESLYLMSSRVDDADAMRSRGIFLEKIVIQPLAIASYAG